MGLVTQQGNIHFLITFLAHKLLGASIRLTPQAAAACWRIFFAVVCKKWDSFSRPTGLTC